jgi:LytS/YehU family sensor histidine kinase
MRIWTLLLAVFVSIFLNWVLKKVYGVDSPYSEFIAKGFNVRFCYHFLMISFISLVMWIWYFVKEIQEDDTRKTQAEQLAKEAELNNIRQQLQPHFLFNSLNSISALAGSRPEEARKMIQQLSDFLRGTMRKDEQQLIKLEDELTHLKLYLDIEKVRFGHRLKNEILCDEKSLSMLLPSLILQPVVENAIKFGLYDTTDDITISVSSIVEENHLIIIVKNPFDPQTSSPKQGVGFGLNSINRRLYLLFARQDLLQTHSENNQFITTIKIPQV